MVDRSSPLDNVRPRARRPARPSSFVIHAARRPEGAASPPSHMVRSNGLAFESPGKAWAPVSGKRRRQAPLALREATLLQQKYSIQARGRAPRSPSPANAAARDPREDKARARGMPTAEDFDRLLQPMPEYLRHGPISPVAPLTICCIAIYTVCTWPEVALLVPSTEADVSQLETAEAAFASNRWFTLWQLHAACCAHGVLVLLQLRSIAGWWPLVTYTVTSWNLQVIRLGLLTLRMPQSIWIAERLRFACLAGHTTTFVIWWLVLVPIIYKVLPARRRAQFTKLNTSPLLINLHVVNLAVAILDFTAAPRRLHLADLYIAVIMALVYIVFYLIQLDGTGVQLYIILTPRTHLCGCVYVASLGLYYAWYQGWDAYAQHLLEQAD